VFADGEAPSAAVGSAGGARVSVGAGSETSGTGSVVCAGGAVVDSAGGAFSASVEDEESAVVCFQGREKFPNSMPMSNERLGRTILFSFLVSLRQPTNKVCLLSRVR
jgi:hypothetical protein